MNPAELAACIAGAQAGDPAAFDRLVDLFADRLYGYLYRLSGSRIEAEDLLQEVFVRLVQAIGRYEHRDTFEAFVFRIATNLHHDRVRRLKRSGVVHSLDAAEDGQRGLAPDREPAPERALERAEQVEKLQWALSALPAAEKEVILLRHFTDLSFKDIAAAMGTPLGTALARAHRGLARLRSLVEDHRDD